MKSYTCQCSRCDGTGRFDRGTCFGCKGLGYRNQKTKPRGLTLHPLTVSYTDGSQNHVEVWASSQARASAIVARTLRINGWRGVVQRNPP